MTLEKPTRGKPVREGFLLFVSFREISFYNIFIFINYTNLSQTFFCKNPSEQSQESSSISVPEICTTVWFSKQ
jgi:hypothetical protein